MKLSFFAQQPSEKKYSMHVFLLRMYVIDVIFYWNLKTVLHTMISRQAIRKFWMRFWDTRFPIFVLVGFINTVFAYSLYVTFIYLGVHYSIAILLSTCCGVMFNFMSTGRIVFKNKNNKLIVYFILVYIILYFINFILVRLFYAFVPNYYIDGALALCIIPAISFWLNKRFVFYKPSK